MLPFLFYPVVLWHAGLSSRMPLLFDSLSCLITALTTRGCFHRTAISIYQRVNLDGTPADDLFQIIRFVIAWR